MDQQSSGGCPPPLILEGSFPSDAGEIAGRFCRPMGMTMSGPLGIGGPPPGMDGPPPMNMSGPSCCLPCPSTDWVYSDNFRDHSRIANYIAIVSLILNSFLLLTFILIPREKSHRHYLSIGLTVSLIFIAIAFVIPLGTEPDFCYNAITPNNLRTQASCGASGVFLLLGAMGAVVWILLRSIWTVLRIATTFKRAELFKKIAIALGIGLPILFMAISLPIAGVTYSLGNVCVPSQDTALPTWFAWILIFATVGQVISIFIILYCLWKFASFRVTGPSATTTSQSSIPTLTSDTDAPPPPQKPMTAKRRRKVAWRKVKSILILQWRSIVMAFIVVNITIYFGIVFIEHVAAYKKSIHAPPFIMKDLAWFDCLAKNDGDKTQCRYAGAGLGLSESRAVGTLILASCIGVIVFLLMVRTSMFVGWWELIRNPKKIFRRPSLQDNINRRPSEAEKTLDPEEDDYETTKEVPA